MDNSRIWLRALIASQVLSAFLDSLSFVVSQPANETEARQLNLMTLYGIDAGGDSILRCAHSFPPWAFDSRSFACLERR